MRGVLIGGKFSYVGMIKKIIFVVILNINI